MARPSPGMRQAKSRKQRNTHCVLLFLLEAFTLNSARLYSFAFTWLYIEFDEKHGDMYRTYVEVVVVRRCFVRRIRRVNPLALAACAYVDYRVLLSLLFVKKATSYAFRFTIQDSTEQEQLWFCLPVSSSSSSSSFSSSVFFA